MLKKVLFLLAAVSVLVTGCKDDELAPTVTQDTLLFGAFPFLNELKTAEFDLADLSGSAYEMDVYFVDNAGGQNVGQYNVYVSFDDNNPDGGDLSTGRALFKSYGPSDFAPLGDKGNLGLTVRIPFSEVAAFVGASNADDVISGDRFQFSTEIVHVDGRVFSSGNSTPAITNAFGGIFDFNVNATCPLPDDFFVGTYALSYDEVYDEFDLFGGGTFVQALGDLSGVTVDLTTVAGSTTRRNFLLGERLWLPTYGFDVGSPTLEFACDVVTSSNVTNSASCGDGPIGAIQTGTASFDLTDDSTITIGYNDFATGGCLGETKFFSIVFTKQ
ncbi:hypothetical protein FUA23_02305 [Neolewinella aurantiaca]|uniref:Lipoprotein n=1 Tax=Neolewinella aurantiaca TaxID=2602767 RepID=A0A5C7FTV7_9BACT|nr:hypothetical protein [Neolewinella aurantiaca]TXF91551.1 hypothetical protein FUA23_02305 [Neolewinella aurantiaca]